MDSETADKILAMKNIIAKNFTASDWEELGLITGFDEVIRGHSRLLRSMRFGDDDYEGCVMGVLRTMDLRDPHALPKVQKYLDRKYPDAEPSQYVSSKPSPVKLTFAPDVFELPEKIEIESDLVAVMMPFDAAFDGVHQAIKAACRASSLKSQRADDIWDHATIIQDVFSLILRSRIVLVDFTGRNPNVMYETGIAHTLGKHVVPISQSLDDVPFDLKHHRVLKYLPNAQGLKDLESALSTKLSTFGIPIF